jgi:hypothetical protein
MASASWVMKQKGTYRFCVYYDNAFTMRVLSLNEVLEYLEDIKISLKFKKRALEDYPILKIYI